MKINVDRWLNDSGGKTKYSERSIGTFSTSYRTWAELGWNPGLRDERPATDSPIVQFVPRSEHTAPLIKKTSTLYNVVQGNYRCSEVHAKYINTVCGQNVELMSVVYIMTTGL